MESEDDKQMKDVLETIKDNRKKLDELPSIYMLNATDVWEIADHAGMKLTGEIVDAITAAYEYGFIKGSRYEKNRSRVKYSEKIANETSAAYSYGVIIGRQQKENESKG